MKKKPTNFRFYEKDLTSWNRIAKKKRLTLTGLIEKIMNKVVTDEDPHLFI